MFIKARESREAYKEQAEPKGKKVKTRQIVAFAILFAAAGAWGAEAVDVGAAESLMKRSNCSKCHALEAKKDGPSFKETAGKYRGKPDAEQTLFVHLTTNPKIKVDGKEELHDTLKTKNEADIRNVVRWILSRQ